MNRIMIIAPPCLESSPSSGGKGAPLANAAAALVAAGLPGRLERSGARIERIEHPLLADSDPPGDPIEALGAYNGLIARTVSSAVDGGAFPLLVGGSCSHLPGMIGGLQHSLGATSRIGLLWLDAHGDFNTPRTSHSGMLGGMPVAVTVGLCHAPWREGAGIAAPLPTNRIMMIDVRNLDAEEEALIRATDVQVVRFASETEFSQAIEAVRDFAAAVDHLYVHIDADVLDASLQPNHPTLEPDGLSVAQTLMLVEAAMEPGTVVAFGVVSINPEEPGGRISLRSGMELIEGGVARWLSAGSRV